MAGMNAFQQMPFFGQAAIAFGGGLLAFLSPCVLPLLPSYLGLMSGLSVNELRGGKVATRHMLKVSVLFVLGFTLVFVALGAIATSVSSLLLTNRSTLERGAGVLVIAFGIIMIGMSFTNRGIFGFFSRERRIDVRPSKMGNWAAPLMGIAFGFGWSPCIGTILTGVLAVASLEESVMRGMLLLFVFSMGMGLPFIGSALGVDRALTGAKRIGRWLRPINLTAGILMTGFGLLLVTGNVFRLAVFFQRIFQAIPVLERLAQI